MISSLEKKLEAKRGKLKGLYKKFLIYPELLEKFSDLGGFLRFEGEVDTPYKKYLILSLAHLRKALPVWENHSKDANLSSYLLTCIQKQQKPDQRPYDLLFSLLSFFLEKKPLPFVLLQALEKKFGKKGVYELLTLLGFYETLISSSLVLSLY